MDADAVALFFTLSLIGGGVGLLAALSHSETRQTVAEAGHTLAAVVATAATAGSLYFSEVADFIPCELCWYQRIAMYPAALLLVVGAIRRDRSVLVYGRILAVLGLVVALYHSQLQAFPEQGSFCGVGGGCSAKLVDALGFMTIPRMAVLAFAGVAVLTTIAIRNESQPESPT